MANETPTTKKKIVKFPKRFELEGIDPLTVPVTIVRSLQSSVPLEVYPNIHAAEIAGALTANLAGPMADKINDQWCLRFESREVYRLLSSD